MNSTPHEIARLCLDELARNHGLKGRGTQFHSNSPFRSGSDSGAFSITLDDTYGGGLKWKDHAGDKTGNGITLARHLGVLPEFTVTPTKRGYSGIDDYAEAHGLTADELRQAGITEGTHYCSYHTKRRPALLITTANGTRARYLDDLKPIYTSPKGFTACWYRLDIAIGLTKATPQPLVLCNGEVSTIAAQLRGIAATALAGGTEKGIKDELIAELQDVYTGPVLIAFDCDTTGREGARKVAQQLTSAGFDAQIVNLNGGESTGGDLADFVRLPGNDTPEALQACIVPNDHELPASPSAKLLHASQLPSLAPSDWLIEGVLPTNKLAQIFGMPGQGKSFANLDIALSVAQFANVVYIAAEDAEDYQVRAAAWCMHHKAGLGGLHFWPEAVNLFKQESLDSFLAEVQPINPALIIIDPLANCMVGGDESSTRDMTIAVDALNYIRRQTHAALLICHHTGWSDAHERGSSVLRGACRVVMKLSNNDGLIELTCEKINGGKAFEPRYFQLQPIGESVVPVPTSKLNHQSNELTQKQLNVMHALNLQVFAGGASFSQLYEHLGVAKSSLNYSLSKLIERDLVNKEGRGHMQRYSLTAVGDLVLQNDLRSTVQSSSVDGLANRTSTEQALNWHVRSEVLGPKVVQYKNEAQRESSVQFSQSSVPVQPPVQSSVQSPPFKGTEQQNTEQQNGATFTPIHSQPSIYHRIDSAIKEGRIEDAETLMASKPMIDFSVERERITALKQRSTA